MMSTVEVVLLVLAVLGVFAFLFGVIGSKVVAAAYGLSSGDTARPWGVIACFGVALAMAALGTLLAVEPYAGH